MIISKSPLVLTEILVLIVLFGYSVNGNEKLATQCANQGELCDEYRQDSCCDNTFVCKTTYENGQPKCTKKREYYYNKTGLVQINFNCAIEFSSCLAKLNDSCRTNADCSDILHSKCSLANKCVCRLNNIPVNNTDCAPLLNEFCWKNEKCVPANSICLDNECKCRNGYLPKSNNQCVLKVLGASCENDTTCEQIKFAKCSSQNICVCTSNTIATSPILCSPLLEEPCESKYECGVANSVCINNKCQCESQYTSQSNTACELQLAYLGMACEFDIYCQNLINYTICNIDEKCICSHGYFPKNFNTCGRAFNTQCFANDQCATIHSMCIDYKCQCKRNYVFKNSKCVPNYLNEPCETSADCEEIKFAVCSEDRTCRCEDEYFAFNKTKCVVRIGGYCLTNQECHVKNSHCVHNECTCKIGYANNSKKQCLPIKLNRLCDDDNDCELISNAICSENNRCVCKKNHVKTDFLECAPLLNETCTSDKECVPDNSVCVCNQCQCKFNYLQHSNNRCVLNYLGNRCTQDEDCSMIPYAKCSNTSKCICHSNYVQLNATTCAPLLKGSCTHSTQCVPENSICIDNKCVCPHNYLPRSVDMCLPRLSCRNDENCNKISNSQCSDDNKCVCKLGYSKFDSLICLPLIGSQCNEHKECLVYNSHCDNNICQCLENYVPQSNQQCVSIQLDQVCFSHYDCNEIINSYCSRHNVCVCTSNYIAVNGNMCAPQLNNPCSKTTTCMTNNTICIDDKCQCKPKYVSNVYNNCVPTHLGESCQRDEDCIEIRHAKCFNRMCICKINYIPLNNIKCASLLNGYCYSHADCIVENSVCALNKCRCFFGHSAKFNNICERIPLGKSCEADEDCEYIKNSKCSVDKICTCDVNYYASNKYTCMPSLNAPCLKDVECQMDFAFCIDNMCKCKPNTTAISANQCIITRLLYSCKSTSECAEPWHEQCSKDEKCVCKKNNVALSLSSCMPILGGLCWKDEQCSAENSICNDFRCVCAQNYKPVSNNMCLKVN